MYDLKIRNLASVFVDARKIKTTGPALGSLLSELDEDMVADTIQEVTPIRAAQRLMLRNQDNGSACVLLSNRFDFMVSGTTHLANDLAAFAAEAASKLKFFLSHFNLAAHRLALVQEGLLAEMKPEHLETIPGRLLTSPEELAQGSLFEWDWRQARRISRLFGQSTEDTNTIITVKRCQGSFLPNVSAADDEINFDRIRVDLDINTCPDVTEPRFGPAEVDAFFDEAPNWHANLEHVTEKLVTGEE